MKRTERPCDAVESAQPPGRQAVDAVLMLLINDSAPTCDSKAADRWRAGRCRMALLPTFSDMSSSGLLVSSSAASFKPAVQEPGVFSAGAVATSDDFVGGTDAVALLQCTLPQPHLLLGHCMPSSMICRPNFAAACTASAWELRCLN